MTWVVLDRKRPTSRSPIQTDRDSRGSWNRSAIRSCALAVATHRCYERCHVILQVIVMGAWKTVAECAAVLTLSAALLGDDQADREREPEQDVRRCDAGLHCEGSARSSGGSSLARLRAHLKTGR
jgi:hypothetical protein